MSIKFTKYPDDPSYRWKKSICNCCGLNGYIVGMYLLDIRFDQIRFCSHCFNELSEEYEKLIGLRLYNKNELENIIVQQQQDINKLKYDIIHLKKDIIYKYINKYNKINNR